MTQELDNKKKKKKKIILIVSIILLLMIIAGIIYYIWYKKEYAYLDRKLFFDFDCQVSQDNFGENEKVIPSYSINLGTNEIADCTIDFSTFVEKNKDKKVSEMTIPIYSGRYNEDETVTSITSTSNLWEITKDDTSYHIIAKNKYADYSDLKIKVKQERMYMSSTIGNDDNKDYVNAGKIKYKLFDDKKTYEDSMFSNYIKNYYYRAVVNSSEKKVKFYKASAVGERGYYSYQFVNEYETKSSPLVDFDSKNGVALIYDEDNTILYNVDKGIVGKYQMGPVTYNLFTTYEENEYSSVGDLIYVHGTGENDKYGIIDKEGNLKHDYTLNGTHSIGHGSGRIISEEYSIPGNIIIDKKDDKFGIAKLDSSEMLVDYIYEDIILIDKDYYIGKNDGKWVMYNIQSGKRTTRDSYDMILAPTKDILIVQEDGYLYFTDIYGKHYTEKNIKVLAPYLTYWERDNTKNAGITYEIEYDSRIKVTVYSSNNLNASSHTYTFYISSKELYDR